ncbi:MAG TPA: magnesium-translocating P-type ATPase [Candidatus Limnocylindrales bacterium]|nr:magnesium-translocating P-type ATPase [Candidatus Limnocylindrales bacterium]
MKQVPLTTLFEQLRTSERGLTSQEASRRLAEIGPNEPVPPRRTSSVVQILLFFVNPLTGILLIASFVSAFLGELLNASIIVVIVLLSVILNFIQTYRSQRAAERLRGQVASLATVLRDGNWVELPRRELVPGDIIRLTAGDLVPADARLLQAKDLHVQQAMLTGESLPVEKEAIDFSFESQSPLDARNMVFLGTSVVSGMATALVISTGSSTAFGNIAARLTARPPETEFERGIRKFSFLIMQTVFFLVLFVFLVNIILQRDPLESLLFAIALAVGLTPEFLPMITTITLTQGAVHMARQKVIVKHLAAIQNFGSIDVLCSDKTGTLTSGEMVLDQYLDPLGKRAEKVFLLAYLNSFYETGVKHPLDAAILRRGNTNPLDTAILQHDYLDVRRYRKRDEIPFDFERRRLSVVVETDGECLLITKGAPEGLLALCSTYEVNGQRYPLDPQARTKCKVTYQELSAQGYRVLAVAYRPVPPREVYSVTDEMDLVLAGFVTFFDPLVEDVPDTLQALHRDGVKVKILTGDNELVARHICSQVGLEAGRIVLGEELDRMSDPALAHVADQVTVFARVSPAQKNRIILALKRRGHVVGFLGDGINDAPSLYAADVGISVATGVDVAKDAADIILLERGLQVLHSGIIEGRKAFGNVMKYLLMGTSSNFGNMFSMAGASLFLPFLPMLPMQILLNNFLYDLAQVTIPTDNVDPTFTHKPRRWNISIIRDFMVFIGPISSIYDFLTFFALLKLFHASETLFHTGWFIESLVTQTLVLFIIRTAGNPLQSRPSFPLTSTTLLVVFIGILLPFTPLAVPLGFTPLPGTYFIFLISVTSTYLLLVELAKRRLMRPLLS